MRRWKLVLAVLAIAGWLGAFVSHLRSLWVDDEETRSRLTVRRNQFLLLSSLCMNTLVFSTLFRYVRRVFEMRRGSR